MKKIIIIFYIVALVFCCISESNSQAITWRRTYHTIDPSTSGLEGIRAIAQTEDGGYIAAGSSRQVAGGNSGYMFAMGINPFGDSLWFRVYNNLQAEKIIKVNKGNYVIMSLRAELVKINSIGDTIWTKVRPQYNLGSIQIKYLNNEFYICGKNRNNDNPFLLKLDSLGNDIFYREYNYFIYGTIRDLIIDNDKIFLFGDEVSPHTFLIMTDLNGNVIGIKDFTVIFFGNSLIKHPVEESILIGGHADPLFARGVSAALMKVDTSGNILWKKSFDPGAHYFSGDIKIILNDLNGGIISLGMIIPHPMSAMARLMKFDYDGNKLWSKEYGFDEIHYISNCMLQTIDSGYVIGGIKNEKLRNSFHVIKTDKFGNVPVSILNNNTTLPLYFELYQNYPNPFNSSTVIKFEIRKISDIKISLYNLEGKLIETIVDNKFGIGVHSILFQPKNLSSGIYYYFLSSDDLIITKKLVYLK